MVIMMKDIDDWLDRDFHKWFLRIINTKKKKKMRNLHCEPTRTWSEISFLSLSMKED